MPFDSENAAFGFFEHNFAEPSFSEIVKQKPRCPVVIGGSSAGFATARLGYLFKYLCGSFRKFGKEVARQQRFGIFGFQFCGEITGEFGDV